MTSTLAQNVVLIPRRLSRLAMLAAIAMAIGGPASVSTVLAQSVTKASDAIVERGTTRPKEEPKLVFYGPGVVAKVNVEEGQEVKVGDLLAVQDDRAEQVEMAKLQGDLLTAELQIKAAEADVKQKRVALKRKQELYAELIARGGSNTELEEAQVAVEIGDIATLYRRSELEKTKMELKASQIKLDLRKLVSPVNGYVAKIDVHEGEGSDLSKAAIIIVQNDTLKVEVDVPATRAKSLKIGDTLDVSYLDEKDNWMQAKITFLSPYANASSGTRKIRLEMPNAAKREAGLAVNVQLKKAVASADTSSK